MRITVNNKRLCEESWLTSYLKYTAKQESPNAFHIWTALAILAATVGSNVYIPRIKYRLYPNLFVILVAGSAKCKKSSAIHIGESILKSIDTPPLIFAQKITTEALIEAMTKASSSGIKSAFVCADELSIFMGSDTTKTSIIPLLTGLYDNPDVWTYQTRSRGKETIEGSTVTILAGTTPVWLKSAVPQNSVGGGFTSRINFVYQDMPSCCLLFHEETNEEVELRAKLISDLSLIQRSVRGCVKFTDKAKERAELWYKKEWSISRDDRVDGYFARKHDTMFKVATLLSIAQSNDLVITDDHIFHALWLLEDNEEYLMSILDSITSNETGEKTEKVLNIIKIKGEIAHSDLLRKCWRFANGVDLAVIVKTLIESGDINETIINNKKRVYSILKRR